MGTKHKQQVKGPKEGKQINYARLYKDPNLENFEAGEIRDIGDQEQRAFELVKTR